MPFYNGELQCPFVIQLIQLSCLSKSVNCELRALGGWWIIVYLGPDTEGNAL